MADQNETTAEKPWLFKPGNPGRPKGSRHKTLLAMEALLDGEAEGLTRKAVEMALSGDTTAMRLCMERLIPVRRDRPVSFPMPKIETAADASAASIAIVAAVADGDITPAEAADVGKVLELHVKTLEATEFERRLAALEAKGAHR